MDILRRQALPFIVAAFILGFVIGLVVFGWNLTPLQFTGAGPQDLQPVYIEAFVRNLADVYSFDGNQERVRNSLINWPEADQEICRMAATTQDQADAARLTALAAVLNGAGCAAVPVVPAEPEETGAASAGLLLICGLALVLAVILGAIFLLMGQRIAAGRSVGGAAYRDMPTGGPMVSAGAGEQQTIPIARFQSTYQRGHDSYDDSFSIENANGDFLGECGVGISETIGADSPRNVTAFEVWLFDKNDIRTVTKVIMSDHAFFDEAIKAKLAPKGEPVLARPNETIVLETASLIVNADIVELEYGNGSLPPQSFIERFTVELSAWAKVGDFGEPDVQGRIDEMLNF